VYLGRNAVYVLLIGFLVMSAIAFLHAQPDSQRVPAEQFYKNIQILKGVPADQVLPAMQFMTSSLGVHCDHCHIEGAFDKDDKKPKQQAREMMKMVTTINHDNFGGARGVTCYTCHRGLLRPKRTPKVAAENQVPAKAAAVPTASAVSQIIDRYMQAVGGTAAIKKITSVDAKGVMQLGGGIDFPMQILLKEPGMRSTVVQFSNGDSVEVLTGESGWSQLPGRPLHTMSKEELQAARIEADPMFIAGLRNSFEKMEVRHEKEIDGRKVIGVRASNPNAPPVRMYFDEQSGLLVRLVRYVESPLGRNPTEIDYSDYRDVAGSKQPFRWVVSQPQGRYTVQLKQMDVNVPINDSQFARPTTTPGM
jgi:photosynthetic reaction center cytochrome c subunit